MADLSAVDPPAAHWSVAEACAWLDRAGLTDYIPSFQAHQIDGPRLVG
jgi:hypothetical protein